MSPKKLCQKCNYKDYSDIPHDAIVCLQNQLESSKREIKKLNDSVAFWKLAWFEVRDNLGKLWWHHPAIDNDAKREYYRDNLNRLNEADMVSAKTMVSANEQEIK